MPPRNSVVKVMTPPDDDAVKVVADTSSGEVKLEDATFDAFKAVPVSERRASQQNLNAARGLPTGNDGSQMSTAPVMMSPHSAAMRRPAGPPMPMMNPNGHGPPRGPGGPFPPFLMQVPQGMNNGYGPMYMPPLHPQQLQQQQQQQQQQRPMPPGMPMMMNNNLNSPNNGVSPQNTNMAKGNGPHLPEISQSRQNSLSSSSASTPSSQGARTSQPMIRPHPPPQAQQQQRAVALPDNGAMAIPDPVEDANQRFKQAKKQSTLSKRERKQADRQNSAPQLRAVKMAQDNLSKRHSDPLPEIMAFDDSDFGMIPMRKDAPRVSPPTRSTESPPADATEAILTNMGDTKSAKALARQISSGAVGQSSLTDIPATTTTTTRTDKQRAAPSKPTAQHSRASSSDSDRDLHYSESSNFSLGSFGFGNQMDMSGSQAALTRSTELARRTKPTSAGSSKRITSPVASLDYIANLNPPGAVHNDSFMERYFGFQGAANLSSPLARTSARAQRNSSANSRDHASGSVGPSGEGIFGTPLANGNDNGSSSFTERRGSANNRSGASGFGWGNMPSTFGSAMFGSFANGSRDGSASLYPSDSGPSWAAKDAANNSAYGAAGLDSFLLSK